MDIYTGMNFDKYNLQKIIKFEHIMDQSKSGGRRYVFFSFPGTGHVNPTLIMVKKLVEMGNTVKYLCNKAFQARIEATGAQFIDYECPIFDKPPEPQPEEVREQCDIFMGFLRFLDKLIYPTLAQKVQDIDVVIYDNLSLWGKRFADEKKLPYFCNTSTLLAIRPDFSASYESTIGYDENKPHHKEFTDWVSGMEADGIIHYSSPDFLRTPLSEEQKEKFAFFGNRFSHELGPSMAEFNSKSLIYISVGTTWGDSKEVMKTFATYLSGTEHEVIISAGRVEHVYEKLIALDLGKNVRIERFVDQLEILGKASLFVSHSGANSVFESLYFGVPMIMIPQICEQRTNALIVKGANAGYILPLKTFSVEEVEKAMTDVKENWPKYKQGALKVRELILNSPDPETSVKKMNSILEKREAKQK